MAMTTVVVANGPMRWTPDLVQLAARAQTLVAADGGANSLADVGLRPELVVGDLDSIRPGVRAWLGEDRMQCRADQDRTDLDKALELVLDERGLRNVMVLGATGGRLDHAVGNLGILVRRGLGESLVFVASDHRVVAVSGRVELAARAGETWSFWTFDPAVRVTLGGVRWPVTAAALDPAGRPSISNVATGDVVTVETVAGGAVIALRWPLTGT
jgi:thiamine pyrophosphokinase